MATEIGRQLNINVYHRDQISWMPDWQERPMDEQIEMIKAIAKHERWIFDGNMFGASLTDGRYERCEVLIHLDVNRFTCCYRALRRYVKHRNHRRHDLAQGCDEDIDLGHVLGILFNYPSRKKKREEYFRKIQDARPEVIVLTKKKEIEKWIKDYID